MAVNKETFEKTIRSLLDELAQQRLAALIVKDHTRPQFFQDHLDALLRHADIDRNVIAAGIDHGYYGGPESGRRAAAHAGELQQGLSA